jgi:hypothetical protein
VKDAGMITDAKWLDIDGDGKQDLVTVSEWGFPMVLKNSGRRLTRWTSALDSLQGWWKALESADLDGDGDLDLILGNKGLNTPYVGTKDHPMKLWINDFDENGTIEKIITSHYNDGDYPIHMRKELTAQLPGLKKQNLKASEYSKRTIHQLFDPQTVENSIVRPVNVSTSVIAVNDGNGKFSIVTLPERVQWSCVSAISAVDVNNDGILDLVMGGNNFEFKPQFSRQDASYGHVLIGDGKMKFTWTEFLKSGFYVREEIRHLEYFTDKSGTRHIIAAINNGPARVFKINKEERQ